MNSSRSSAGILGAVCLLALSLILAESPTADARPRRGAPKPVDHYTFSPERLSARLDPLRADYDHVIALNELHTIVSKGGVLCRIDWTGHRIDALSANRDAWTIAIPLPRGASVDKVEAYLIEDNGRNGRKVDDPTVVVHGDSLMTVTIDGIGDERVVELRYSFKGSGVSVEEGFLFQPEVPVASAQYKFSVSRDLWQAAANAGLQWEFTAATTPSTWSPEHTDTPDMHSWTWRGSNFVPIVAQPGGEPQKVAVAVYLPTPALARIDPDDLPDVGRFDVVQKLERLLRENLSDADDEADVVAPTSEAAGGATREPSSGGGKRY